MRTTLTIISVILTAAFFAVIADARPLSPLEERGKIIYTTGKSPSGKTITGWFGKDLLEVPGTSATCASCHGYDGSGRTESGITSTPLGWNYLMKSYGHIHLDGVEHEPFDPDSLRSYLRDGVYPGEVRGNPAMPVYDIAEEDLDALLSYLRRLGTEMDPGLTPRSIRLGVPVGRQASGGSAMLETVQAFFNQANLRGGIYGRKIEVVPVAGEFSPSAEGATRSAQESDIFAFVSGAALPEKGDLPVSAGSVPWVGPHGVAAPEGGLPGTIFYLTAGAVGEAGALASAATELSSERNSVAVVTCIEGDEAILHASEVLKRGSWKSVSTVSCADAESAAFIARLREKPPEALLILAHDAERSRIIKALRVLPALPPIFLSGGENSAECVTSGGQVFSLSAFPISWGDVGAAAEKAAAQYGLPRDSAAQRISALAAAHVLAEGLKSAGRELSREKLVLSLEKLYRFETGFTSPITFGRNSRSGIRGAYVYSVKAGGDIRKVGWFSGE